jgi:hypothetical protein
VNEYLLVLILVDLLLYFKTLRYKFVSDDFSTYLNPPVFKNRWHRRWLQFTGACKLMSKSFHFMKFEGKWKMVIVKTEEGEHLYALIIHTGIVVSIWCAFGGNYISWIAALLYATNPVNMQGTVWGGGRGYALPILSILISMSAPFLSPFLLYFCSYFTVGFLAPLCLIGSKWWWILVAMPLIWFLRSKKFMTAIKSKRSAEVFDEDREIHPRKLILAIKTFGFYLILCLIPFRITFYHNFLQSCAGNDIMRKRAYKIDRYFLIGIVSMASMVSYAIMVPWNTLSWALLAWSISIAPFCNLVRNNQEIAERFVALANVFLMYALAQVIFPHPIIVTAFLVFYATRTFYTLSTFKDEYIITEIAVIEDPHAWWAWHCRAMKRWDTQSYKEALILWTMAKLISPKEFKILMNIATCLRLLKNDKEADAFLREAENNIVKGQEEEAHLYIENHRNGKLPILL